MHSRNGAPSKQPRNSPFAGILLGFLSLFAMACAGYQLGPSNGTIAGAKSIEIRLFQNNTLEPRLSEAIGTAVRRNIQRDGTFRLETRGDADIVVTGTIKRYERAGVSFQPTDILTVRDFDVAMVATVKAVDRRTGAVVLDRDVIGRTTIRAEADLSSAERQAVPLLAEDMAKNLTAMLADGTW